MPDTSPVNFDRANALGTAQNWAFHHANDAQDHYDMAEAYALASRSRAMAETWARVACALATPATADGQPATYDVHVAIPDVTADELQRRLRAAQKRAPGNGG